MTYPQALILLFMTACLAFVLRIHFFLLASIFFTFIIFSMLLMKSNYRNVLPKSIPYIAQVLALVCMVFGFFIVNNVSFAWSSCFLFSMLALLSYRYRFATQTVVQEGQTMSQQEFINFQTDFFNNLHTKLDDFSQEMEEKNKQEHLDLKIENYMEQMREKLVTDVQLNIKETFEEAKKDSVQTKDLETYKKHIQEELQAELTKKLDGTNALLEGLQESILVHGEKVESIQNMTNEYIQSNPALTQEEAMEKAIEKLREQRISFSNNKMLSNHELKDYFHKALQQSTSEVCIVSPWLAGWLKSSKNDIHQMFISLLEKGVTLKITYGIGGTPTEDNYKNKSTENVAQYLKEKFQKYGDQFRMQRINTHYKLLICDESFYINTSFNLLSNKGDFDDETMWHEGGEYSENLEMLRQLKKEYFDY